MIINPPEYILFNSSGSDTVRDLNLVGIIVGVGVAAEVISGVLTGIRIELSIEHSFSAFCYNTLNSRDLYMEAASLQNGQLSLK